MTTKETYMAALCHALGFSDEGVTLTPEVITLAAVHGTQALITKDKALLFANAQRQEVMHSLMQRAIEALKQADIQPVVIKGFNLAQLYPEPYLREWGDIDIYVGKDSYHAGAKALRDAFPEAALFDEEKDYYKHYNLTFYQPIQTAIEMHRVAFGCPHPRDARLFEQLEKEGLVNGTVEWRFNVLFTFCHSWEHWIHNSAIMRQLCDIALLLTQGKPDTVSYEQLSSYLSANLKKLHLLQAWQLYAYILVNELAVPAAQCPLYTERVAKRANALLNALLYGRKSIKLTQQAPKNIILRKAHTFFTRVREAQAIGVYEPHYARHMVIANIAQSWQRFLRGENTRKWE